MRCIRTNEIDAKGRSFKDPRVASVQFPRAVEISLAVLYHVALWSRESREVEFSNANKEPKLERQVARYGADKTGISASQTCGSVLKLRRL